MLAFLNVEHPVKKNPPFLNLICSPGLTKTSLKRKAVCQTGPSKLVMFICMLKLTDQITNKIFKGSNFKVVSYWKRRVCLEINTGELNAYSILTCSWLL